MVGRTKADKPGTGKLLDAWVAPENAGEPIGCLATTFTFSAEFFEQECLARFLQLETDPTEDGPAYLIEREEKMSQLACAAALVDQHHCRGRRNLRWDLIPIRLPKGILHAKISLLYWLNHCRLIIGSANLTEDGYRRNLEVFGVVDFHPDGDAPISCLTESLKFLRQVCRMVDASDTPVPEINRCMNLLDRIQRDCKSWGVTDDKVKKTGVRVYSVFTGFKYHSLFDQLKSIWPAASSPSWAQVVSPFFDLTENRNAPTDRLWKLLKAHGEASVGFNVITEEIPGKEGLLLHAPHELMLAQPPDRRKASTKFFRAGIEDTRPLHAKGIWLEDDRWCLYLVGSSNFTSAGTGISQFPNLEANLVFLLDQHRNSKIYRLLSASYPEGDEIDVEAGVQWKSRPPAGEDDVAEEICLPVCFGEAIFETDSKGNVIIQLKLASRPPEGWELLTEQESERFWGQQEWESSGQPQQVSIPWTQSRPPSGFYVRWPGSNGLAWWPVNLASSDTLPPPEELKDLPLEMLVNILSSAKPLHRVLANYLKRQKKKGTKDIKKSVIDPHKRVDTSQFLLQRTRRISEALNVLRDRLERPASTMEMIQWRLRGPVGIQALVSALLREAQSDDEKVFLLSEIVLTLGRVQPKSGPGCVKPQDCSAEIRLLIDELRLLLPSSAKSLPENMKQYVDKVFQVAKL